MTAAIELGDVEQFRAQVCLRLGLYFDDAKLEYLAEILRARMAQLRCDGVEHYLRLFSRLGEGRDELRALALQLTVGETYFFRNPEQFNAVAQCAIPHIQSSRGAWRQLRVLSAGSASGEEAYSLAILMREQLPEFETWDVKICGIDVNAAALDKARIARYTEWSLRGTSGAMRERHFQQKGQDFVLQENVRKMVSFEERNLLDDDDAFWRAGSFDIVFCRNVTMYFPTSTTRKVLARIARATTPGGFLFLGHAETLRDISNDFELRHSHDTFYYQRREQVETGAAAAGAQNDISWAGAIQESCERIEKLARGSGEGVKG